MPCSSGVDIPEVLAAVNRASVWNDPDPWATGYSRIEGKASKCTECNACEEVCPQELPVTELMREAVSLFGE
jgi:predicted aldo/keto reductase-like oxidoreductase